MLGTLDVTGIKLTSGLVVMRRQKVGLGFRLLFDRVAVAGECGGRPFNDLAAASSATTGTGNIAGGASGIALGSPGAIFYMCPIALFGMATKYVEAFCAVTDREIDASGKYIGGQMYYRRNGVGEFVPEFGKWMGPFFAIFGAVAAFGTGNAVQVNSMTAALGSIFGLST